MTNFVNRVLQPEHNDFPVRSLLDVDFYKFTMLYFIWSFFPDMTVRYEYINRATTVPVARIVDERSLRLALDHARTLRFTERELAFLSRHVHNGKRTFSAAFITFLRTVQLPEYELQQVGDQYVLVFDGPWIEVELWETIALAIISELYSNALLSRISKSELEALYTCATDKLEQKMHVLQEFPGVRFADFGLRRRHNFFWQNKAIATAKQMLGSQFLGTSNVHYAAEHSVTPIGTNAHSLQMALMARDFDELFKLGEYERIHALQYDLLTKWAQLYGSDMHIFLPDTYGTKQFLEGAPEWLAHDWRGARQDSGDPFEVGEFIVDWYKAWGIKDPKSAGKTIIFSDGLTEDLMVELYSAFTDKINVLFGWGTHFTNGFDGCHPYPDKSVPGLDGMLWGEVKWAFSSVCKVVGADGKPAVKLPDNLEKSTGPKEEQERYMKVFGRKHRSSRAVVV